MKKLVYDFLLAKNRLNTHYIAEQYLENVSMRNLHNHSHYEILYICENERILIAEKKQYILNANSIALIPPYILHRTLGIGELSNRNGSTIYIREIKNILEKKHINSLKKLHFSMKISLKRMKTELCRLCPVSPLKTVLSVQAVW